MKVEFLEQFDKDLDRIKDKSVHSALLKLIGLLEEANSLAEIPNLKKLQGFKNIYRIRIRDYRVGLIIEKKTIELARILHRKDIYNKFP
jgi:mRNA interferase RelE/StbE